VKLTDFGLASSTMKTEKTAPGIVYGKVSYMSPEQARGEPLDGRTDLYSVAIILWELLTGRQMFPQQDAKLIEKVRAPEVKSAASVTSRVPPELDAIVMKALSRDLGQRYPDCEAFRAALSSFWRKWRPHSITRASANFSRSFSARRSKPSAKSISVSSTTRSKSAAPVSCSPRARANCSR